MLAVPRVLLIGCPLHVCSSPTGLSMRFEIQYSKRVIIFPLLLMTCQHLRQCLMYLDRRLNLKISISQFVTINIAAVFRFTSYFISLLDAGDPKYLSDSPSLAWTLRRINEDFIFTSPFHDICFVLVSPPFTLQSKTLSVILKVIPFLLFTCYCSLHFTLHTLHTLDPLHSPTLD